MKLVLKLVVAVSVLLVSTLAVAGEITINDDFSSTGAAWHPYVGQWVFSNGVLRQQSVDDYYPLILRTDGDYTDVDIAVKFRPISGQIDASGAVVFRAADAKNYYVVRANALEDNFRLYTVVNGWRHQIASATVTPPRLRQYHQLRVVAVGDHIQAWLDGKLLLDHHDRRFSHGMVGLWTKADSVTEFDDFSVRAVPWVKK